MPTRESIACFLQTSHQYLDASEGEQIRHACKLLRNEFLDAIEAGPDAHLSTPQSMRDNRIPLTRILKLMFTDCEECFPGIVHELQQRDGNVALFLAEAYASWVVSSYQRTGAFHA